MLSGTKQHFWKELLTAATPQELIWMNGFLSGLLSHNREETAGLPQQQAEVIKVTIAYGTETGNAKNLSGKLAAIARKQGALIKLVSLDQYKTSDLSRETNLFIVVSTQGDGEPPVAAKKFYDYLHTQTETLTELRYAVLALGDSSYPLFCKTGEDMDQQLEKAGAKRFAPILKCDTDYETQATNWFRQAMAIIQTHDQPQNYQPVPSKTPNTKQHHQGLVLSCINLNDQGSSKETYHIEIAGETIYQPGDSIGILPPNPDYLVDEVISLSGIPGTQKITYREEVYTIYDLVKTRLNISYLPERVVKKYAAVVRQDIPETKIGLLDLLKIYPVANPEQFEEILTVLEPNAPRLYSISSSPSAHNGEIHITVCRNKFAVNQEMRYGLCSDYLSLFEKGAVLDFYIHPNQMFRLPEPGRDIIMIGPGTGIAPFRSYLAEREATGAEGRNWLFFGDQHFISDFLYQTEIQSWQETGLLTRVNVAFSRDQPEKVYVQHKMQEQGATLYTWLETGASVYICGSKEPMANDVEQTLLDIIRIHGHQTPAGATAYLDKLKEEARYHKDVY